MSTSIVPQVFLHELENVLLLFKVFIEYLFRSPVYFLLVANSIPSLVSRRTLKQMALLSPEIS